jgi:hypothetical protein
MAKGKAFLAINMDTVEVSALTGFIETLSTQVNTDRNIVPVLTYAHAAMSQRFDAYMSLVSPTTPNQFHHVYDWGHIGVPQYQLWKNVLKGRGASRYASFEFRASVLPVPVPENENAKKPFKKTHRFIYKAMIMEYNINVTIRPKTAKMLAFPNEEGEIVFTKGPIHVTNPGGTATTGAFTAAWSSWWGGAGANEAFNSEIKKQLEDDFSQTTLARFMTRFNRSKMKSGSIAISNDKTAFAQGARLAEEFLRERAIKNEGRRKSNVL